MNKKPLSVNDYNSMPEGWEPVLDEEDFFRLYLFHYCLDRPISRSIFYDSNDSMKGTFRAMLFDLEYGSDDAAGLGIAIVWDWKANNNKGKPAYFRYGGAERWQQFRSRFASQFAGDNS